MSGTKRVSNIDHNGLTKTTGLPAPTGGTDATNKAYVDAGDTAAEQRANHTGTQTASTISDFDTQVRTSRLDQMASPISAVSFNNQRLSNVGTASADTDAPSLGQIKSLLDGRRKADVKVVSIVNLTLSGTQTVDGVALAAGDRVLVAGQTDATTNGIYDVAAGAWTRDADSDSSAEFSSNWIVTVAQGSINGDSLWQQSTDGVVTLGTSALVFKKIGMQAITDGYTTTSPATAAGGSWTVTHGLASTFVLAQVRRTNSPMDYVDCYIAVTDANNITVQPDISFAAGEYTVLIKKVV
jgi:hypothetical protein